MLREGTYGSSDGSCSGVAVCTYTLSHNGIQKAICRMTCGNGNVQRCSVVDDAGKQRV